MSLIFFALPQKRIISSRTIGRPSRPPTRCINRRRSRRHHLDPDHPNLARPPLLGRGQDSRSHHRSPYQLGRRYSNLAPDLSALRHTHPCIVHRISELRHPKLVRVISSPAPKVGPEKNFVGLSPPVSQKRGREPPGFL